MLPMTSVTRWVRRTTYEHFGNTHMKQKTKINLRRILLMLLLVFLLLEGVLSWNYLTFSSKQLDVDSVVKQRIDTASFQNSENITLILDRLVQAIQIRSISTPMSKITNDNEL